MGSQYQVDQLVAAKLQNINKETVDGDDEEGVPTSKNHPLFSYYIVAPPPLQTTSEAKGGHDSLS